MLLFSCPETWINSELGCFYFAAEAGQLNWFDAQDYCNKLYENAYLAEIKDIETQNLVRNLANQQPDFNWWLGASDFYKEGNWRWERTGEPMQFSAWGVGQPDSHDIFGHTEDCLHLFSTQWAGDRSWNDHICVHVPDEQFFRPLCQLFL